MYERIFAYAMSQYWAMHPTYVGILASVLVERVFCGKPSEVEIESRIPGQTAKAIANKDGNVAVIPVQGVVVNRLSQATQMSGPTSANAETLSKWIESAANDPSIKAIVLDVDSPGGSVSGIAELHDQIMSLRGNKPVIAQVNATAASAAYHIASAADEIVLTPSGEVGSIGVYTIHDNVSKAMEALGVERTAISAGKYKLEGNPWGPLDEEARAAIQAEVDRYYGMFVDGVARGRGVSAKEVREGFGQGRMIGADRAIAEKMADRVATMRETLARFGATSTPNKNAARAKLAGLI